MHPVPRHRNHTPPLVPIDESHDLDPYPERLASLGGVRRHTELESHGHWMVTARPVPQTPSRFGDELPPLLSYPPRTRRLPWASVGFYALGQVILALAIAVGAIGPVTAIGVCVLWMICGLLLVIAQLIGVHS